MILSSDQMNYNKAFKSRQVKDALLNMMTREKDVELIGLRMRTAPMPLQVRSTWYTPDAYLAILYKGDKFCDFLFPFLHATPFWKSI